MEESGCFYQALLSKGLIEKKISTAAVDPRYLKVEVGD